MLPDEDPPAADAEPDGWDCCAKSDDKEGVVPPAPDGCESWRSKFSLRKF